MDVTFFENQPFFTKNFSRGESVSEDRNIWDVVAPIFALPLEPEQPQTPKLEQPQTLPPNPKQPQTPSPKPTMTINKGSMIEGDL